ncbi:hypothetical protein G5B40_09345 [Pikeienuella piscinae]|uniref:Glycosyltransferase 2-like domain-containing protein n=1 Tax=Pikeienuella piscinae TaxID=2748098 RepID=A0A7L5BXR9_9RHOB|nr:hypothetical protein [Pikeienuella piscinae]QIE55638.1 hypothetical protein G5B40_09345 [Pikeienuella piscinae]
MSVRTFSNAIIGSMATFLARYPLIAPVIASIAPQLDHLFIYANETTDGFPNISRLSNVTVLDGREHRGDLSANGKIYPLKFVRDSIVLTLDDDFIFPPDYVQTYCDLIAKCGGMCAVTTHGGVFPSNSDWYFERTHTFDAIRSVREMHLCSLAGSGTFGFDQRTLRFDPDSFFAGVMVDLRLSMLAREQGLPIWVLPRPEGWLRHIRSEGLWEKFRASGLTHHTEYARKVDWSFSIYRQIANSALATAGLTPADLGLDADLAHGLRTGVTPRLWRRGRISNMKRIEYLDILIQQ